jgi:hypothetical protein
LEEQKDHAKLKKIKNKQRKLILKLFPKKRQAGKFSPICLPVDVATKTTKLQFLKTKKKQNRQIQGQHTLKILAPKMVP